MFSSKLFLNTLGCLLILASLTACSPDKEQPPPVSQEVAQESTPPVMEESKEKVLLPSDDQVLARVNNEIITAYDLDQAINRLVGKQKAIILDSAARKKVLEGLVMSRAIAQSELVTIAPEDLAGLERRVAAYREQLLVSRYLVEHAPPKPVTTTMIKEYYQKHLEDFGAKILRSYEMLSCDRNPTDLEREQLMVLLNDSREMNDWNARAEELRKMQLPLSYNKGRVAPNVLQKDLNRLMDSLSSGEVSSPAFFEGRCYLVRVNDTQQSPAKPLREVSSHIRSILSTRQVKDSIQQVGQEILKKATIEYTNQEGSKN